MLVFADNATSYLASHSENSLVVIDGSSFPLANKGDSQDSLDNSWFKVVITYDSEFEICYVNKHDGDGVFDNVLRAQDGTRQIDWPVDRHQARVFIAPVASDFLDIFSRIKNLDSKKLDKHESKVLSDNNFSNELKEKLEGVANGATANETNEYLTDRENHHGTQGASSIHDFHDAVISSMQDGNAASADKLKNAVTLTIGNKSESIDGSSDISFSVEEIGAAKEDHDHRQYLALTGGQMTGKLAMPSPGGSWIQGIAGATAAIKMSDSTASSWHAWIAQKTSGGNAFAIGQLGENFHIAWAAKANIDAGTNASTQLFTLNSSGMSVVGNITATGNITASGSMTASGNVTAYSDRRLKANLTPICEAIDKVSRLAGYTYDRIDIGCRQVGLIAQDVQSVLPEAVTVCDDAQKTLAISYGSLVALLVEAIKELNAKIDSIRQISE